MGHRSGRGGWLDKKTAEPLKVTSCRRCSGLALALRVGSPWRRREGTDQRGKGDSGSPRGVIWRLTCPQWRITNRSQPRVGAGAQREPRGLESGGTPPLGQVLCLPGAGRGPFTEREGCGGSAPTCRGTHPAPPPPSCLHPYRVPAPGSIGSAPSSRKGPDWAGQSAEHLLIGSGKSHDPI